jgi:two-component sensor histidine kinase
VPIKDEMGAVQLAVISASDVTYQVEVREQLLAGERARAELAETLNREISHRTKNNLSMVAALLQMQIAGQTEPNVVAMLQDAISRLYAFAEVHEQLGLIEGADEVNLLTALRRISATVQRAFERERVTVSVEGDETTYPARTATTLCIIANELMTNAIKHGAADAEGELRVRARLAWSKGRLHFTVWNSGNPVPPGLDLSHQPGMGIGLVQSIVVGQYRGTFTLAPSAGGTLARVVLSDELLRVGG